MRTGVLVMAHGTPATREEIASFYTRIRHGRPPSAEQLADLELRYDAIGGTSPLAAVTERQVAGIARSLADDDMDAVVAYGAKHAAPLIEDAAASLVTFSPDVVIGLVLAPHSSSLSTGEYHERAGAALGAVPYRPVGAWWNDDVFLDRVAARVTGVLSSFDDTRRATTEVIFSAHSLPVRVVADGEDYADQVRASAQRVAARASVDRWSVAWQSAGRTPEPWLEPDIRDVLRRARDRGVTDVISCPIGFVADHLEVLYDLDIEAAAVADEAGVGFVRTPSLNDDRDFLEALARLVESAA